MNAVARKPHRGRPGSKATTLDLLRALMDDRRFRALSLRARNMLLAAVIKRADADGVWQWKRSEWARACGWEAAPDAAVPGAYGQAIRSARDCGLLIVEPYIRPPDASTPGQGASIYRLDPLLVAKAAAGGSPSGAAGYGSATWSAVAGRATRSAESGSPERSSNESKNGAPRRGSERVARARVSIIETCIACGQRGACRDDGASVLCDPCRTRIERQADPEAT